MHRKVYYMHSLQVHMYTSCLVIHCIERGDQFPNSKKYTFKWEFCILIMFYIFVILTNG